MKKFIYLLLCSVILVAYNKQIYSANAAPTAKSASEVNATESAAEGKEQVAASSGVSDAKQGGDNSEIYKQFDQVLAQIQKQLPLKMDETLELTSVERRGNKLYISSILKDSKINSKLFNKAVAEQTLKDLCQESNINRILQSGLELICIYHFQDKSELTITLSAKNCQ